MLYARFVIPYVMKRHSLHQTARILFILLVFITACKYPSQFNPCILPPDPEVRGLAIVMSSGAMTVGESRQAEAYEILRGGDRRPSVDVIWESLDPLVLSVNSSGVICALTSGWGRIRAQSKGLSDERAIEVRAKPEYDSLKINEVFYDAEGSDEGKEFIEIRNTGEACDLSGCSIVDGAETSRPFIFKERSVIQAGGFLILAASADGFFELFDVLPDYAGFSFGLNNTGETVFLKKPDGSIIDAVYIRGGTKLFPAPPSWGSMTMPSAPAGMSIQRIDSVDTDTAADWEASPPSPGW